MQMLNGGENPLCVLKRYEIETFLSLQARLRVKLKQGWSVPLHKLKYFTFPYSLFAKREKQGFFSQSSELLHTKTHWEVD